ncbi:Uncharacterised protein [Salmonella enterica subsp. enterica]|uniref:Lipoprotein n=1 Tax=Salmonella enterica I TaxID=59201 RepID=A0A447PY65_SALET|nr:Uncharacterised protein [Salmonella enterica subsp. enterica]
MTIMLKPRRRRPPAVSLRRQRLLRLRKRNLAKVQRSPQQRSQKRQLSPRRRNQKRQLSRRLTLKKFIVKKWMSISIVLINFNWPVQRSLARYADWVKDFKKGPTGKESLVYGIYGITESYITNCQKEMKQVAALTPLLEPIDGVAVSYIDSAAALGNTINEMEKYYTQENYKDDAFAKGKALHQTLLKNIEDFKPVSEKYHEAIQEINDRRQLTQLKRIEEAEGKTFNYYSLAVMISAKQINKVISADTFDAEAMMKKVAELETMIAQLKEVNTDGRNSSFISSAADYQLQAKKYIRRIRDNVEYSDFEKKRVQDPATGWMVADSYPASLRSYNEMVDDYNRLR